MKRIKKIRIVVSVPCNDTGVGRMAGPLLLETGDVFTVGGEHLISTPYAVELLSGGFAVVEETEKVEAL